MTAAPRKATSRGRKTAAAVTAQPPAGDPGAEDQRQPGQPAAPPIPPAAEPAAAGPDPAAKQPPTGVDAAIDLDELEREGEIPKPFWFRHAGRWWHLGDPSDIDWQDGILAMGSPQMFIRFSMPAEDHAAFVAERMPAWKLEALIARYLKHYNLPTQGEAFALPG